MREEADEFLPVHKSAIGFVIGNKGNTIKQIEEKSGAKILNQQSDDGNTGFMIRGNEEQRDNAKDLINKTVANLHTDETTSPGRSVAIQSRFKNRQGGRKGVGIMTGAEVNSKGPNHRLCVTGTSKNAQHAEFVRSVVIPSRFEKLVSGPRGDYLQTVSTMTGAEVSSIGPKHRLYVTGASKNTQHAEFVLRSRVASARLRANTICVYIDKKNLPEGCELKLVPVEEQERLLLSVSCTSQYRLKPADGYDTEVQGACAPDYAVAGYDASLKQRVLSSLREIKLEIGSGNYHKADMWCHFGKVVIRDQDEADLDETWSVADSIKKLQATTRKRSEWLVAFKEGMDLDDRVVYDTFGAQMEEDFMERYDLTFLSPKNQVMRCKVWVANKGVGKKLEEIPIPFQDLKNVVEELRFEDKTTRSRCRGWLVLQSKKFLQANIIFPGSNIDCRISLRALTDDIVVNNSGVHEGEATNLISRYLSKSTFTDADGLRLPTDEKLPQGFIFSHWRSSRRTLYTPRPGFTMIVSKERSWCSDVRNEENRVTTDIHLHCEKWDQLLSGVDWEPQTISAELPEFLQFVRQVQDFISCNCSDNVENT